MADLPAILPTVDIVVILLPLTPQTRGVVDATFLAAFFEHGLRANNTTVNEWLHGIDTSASLQDIRALLGKMLFTAFHFNAAEILC